MIVVCMRNTTHHDVASVLIVAFSYCVGVCAGHQQQDAHHEVAESKCDMQHRVSSERMSVRIYFA